MFGLIRILIFVLGLVLSLTGVWAFLSSSTKAKVINLVGNWSRAAIEAATPLLAEVESELLPIVNTFAAAFKTYAPPILTAIRTPIAGFAKAEFTLIENALTGIGISTPDNATQIAADTMAGAFGLGVASAGVTAAFEELFPKKMNTFNGAGPMLASLAGFDEVSDAVREPLYHNAFGKSLDYHYKSIFKPELPDEQDAVRWHSRGLLDDAALRTVFKFSGLKQEYEQAFVDSAYRPVSPFVLAAGYINADLPTKQLYDAMQFMGLRPKDQDLMFHTIEVRSLQQTRQALVNEAITAYGAGVVDDTELQQILTDSGYGSKASALVMQRALLARRITLARETESFIVPEITQGLITHPQGVQAMEAAGVQAWQAELKATLADTRAALNQARKAAAAAHRLAIQEQRNLTRAAIAEYERGVLDDLGLTAALTALQLDPALVITIVAVESAKRAGRLKLVFGQLLDPTAARVLTEQVAALETQFKKQLIDEAAVRAQLAALKVDQAETDALVARWAAARTAATKTGYPLPV